MFLLSDGTITESEPDGTAVVWSPNDRNGDAINAKYVVVAWYGGHDNYEVTDAQAAILQANGYTVTDNTPPAPTAPVITSLTPSSGLAGSFVNIVGTNFSEVTALMFNVLGSLSFTILSSTQILFQMPDDVLDATWPIALVNPYGTSNSVDFTTVTPDPSAPPAISNVSPSSGIAGTLVTVSGSNFTTTAVVTVDGVQVGISFHVGAAFLTFTAPTHADGSVSIVVTTTTGTSNAGSFTYAAGGGGDPHPGNDILAEDGSYILAEDGVSSIQAES